MVYRVLYTETLADPIQSEEFNNRKDAEKLINKLMEKEWIWTLVEEPDDWLED